MQIGRFKILHRKKKHPQVDPELVGESANLLLKIIGETVHDKVLRGVLVAAVAGTTAYLSPEAQLELSLPPQSQPALPLPGTTAERPRNVCDAGHLDWPSTAIGR
jgi:hypothetical protein